MLLLFVAGSPGNWGNLRDPSVRYCTMAKPQTTCLGFIGPVGEGKNQVLFGDFQAYGKYIGKVICKYTNIHTNYKYEFTSINEAYWNVSIVLLLYIVRGRVSLAYQNHLSLVVCQSAKLTNVKFFSLIQLGTRHQECHCT